jgi:predicted alpha/beta hydrolase family esterase
MPADDHPTLPRVLLLPGWLDSGPGHWQTRWEATHGFERVQQADWLWPKRGDWMSQLEQALLADERPTLLAAHSLGCHLVAAWAAHTQQRGRVSGALLVAPPDLDRADAPPQISTWRPVVRQALPFPALLAHSDDDPFCSVDSARSLALDWGAATWALPGRGHLNAESGLDAWPEGLSRLLALASTSA